jgi:hypothetical protein
MLLVKYEFKFCIRIILVNFMTVILITIPILDIINRLVFYLKIMDMDNVQNCDSYINIPPEARVRFPALPEKKSSGSGTVSTQPREYN